MQINRKRIKNILVVRNDRFGEFLLNIPALRALKETFINARLIAVVDPYVRELAQSIHFIDELIEWGRVKHSLLEKLRFIKLLKKKNINIAVMLNSSKQFNSITFFCGIPIRVGYNRKCAFLLTHKMEDKKYLGNKHEIEYNLELVSLLGAETDNKSPSLIMDDRIIDGLLKDAGIEDYDTLVAIHPWTSDHIKQWPLENFRELAETLIRELNIQILIVGGKENEDKSTELFNNLNSHLINITGRTNLRQLTALLKKSKLLISCDSGPVHLASCVGTPVIAIFRTDLPGKSSTRWGPRSKGSIVIEKNRLLDITVNEVFDKAKDILVR